MEGLFGRCSRREPNEDAGRWSASDGPPGCKWRVWLHSPSAWSGARVPECATPHPSSNTTLQLFVTATAATAALPALPGARPRPRPHPHPRRPPLHSRPSRAVHVHTVAAPCLDEAAVLGPPAQAALDHDPSSHQRPHPRPRYPPPPPAPIPAPPPAGASRLAASPLSPRE